MMEYSLTKGYWSLWVPKCQLVLDRPPEMCRPHLNGEVLVLQKALGFRVQRGCVGEADSAENPPVEERPRAREDPKP